MYNKYRVVRSGAAQIPSTAVAVAEVSECNRQAS